MYQLWSSPVQGGTQTRDRHWPLRAIQTRIQESQVLRASSRNGAQALGGHFSLIPQTPAGPSPSGVRVAARWKEPGPPKGRAQ